MAQDRSVTFFDTQFQTQIAQQDFALNPFEQAAWPHLQGRVLDFGCGLGNLALRAARAGHAVLALDASATAVAHLNAIAATEGLALQAREADLRSLRLDERFDTVLCIGLLMFFERPQALAQLAHLQSLVNPGGVAVLNVLVEGTTYLDMFDPGAYCLFGPTELRAHFAGWDVLADEQQDFDAPGGQRKVFHTLMARRVALRDPAAP